jgi:hypothetical protein
VSDPEAVAAVAEVARALDWLAMRLAAGDATAHAEARALVAGLGTARA